MISLYFTHTKDVLAFCHGDNAWGYEILFFAFNLKVPKWINTCRIDRAIFIFDET